MFDGLKPAAHHKLWPSLLVIAVIGAVGVGAMLMMSG
jgi:hypothetical protein